ncbi:MAG: class I poly(R)-hydroxyalkanoic acid synthase [Desulforegulaceae bacterium]|nr:class I poly(R)-hydroxyalkanoic acid synthase [Desulforegulaceae bacterium]
MGKENENLSVFDLKKMSELMVKYVDKQLCLADAFAMNRVETELPEPAVFFDFLEAFQKFALNPETVFNLTLKTMKDYSKASSDVVVDFFDLEKRKERTMTNRRFRSPEWNRNPFFQLMRDFYLINYKNIKEAVASLEDIDPDKKKRVAFYTKQFLEAVSPANFLATNPEIIQHTFDRKGENLLKGFENFLDDLSCEDGTLDIKISDDSAFKPGKNIALTKGSVVYQNDLLQLIQYSPLTQSVFEVPVLITPPFINKYYILDINEESSLIKWLIEQGYTVFVISWVNPSEKHSEKRYEDYILEGQVEVLDVIEQITKSKKVSGIGYCTGGTLLATTAAYLEAINKQKFASLTYMATLIDFSKPGELGNFLDESQVEKTIEDMEEVGYLDGRILGQTFNMLNPSDLVWSYAVRYYLKGKGPIPFDILYWNSDATNLPKKMYAFYLKSMYGENRLKKPGGITIEGVPIDLSKVKVPSYFLSTENDHIVLWEAAFKGALLFPGKVRFVLGGSGHVVGVINPPFKRKYGYRAAELDFDSPEEFLEKTQKKKGSWWVDWYEWNSEFSGKLVPKRIPGKGKFKEIEKAPGTYALIRAEDIVKGTGIQIQS